MEPPKDRIALKPYTSVGDFEFDKKSNHLAWHKIFGYLLVNHANSTIHYKININANVGDVEFMHEMFGVH